MEFEHTRRKVCLKLTFGSDHIADTLEAKYLRPSRSWLVTTESEMKNE